MVKACLTVRPTSLSGEASICPLYKFPCGLRCGGALSSSALRRASRVQPVGSGRRRAHDARRARCRPPRRRTYGRRPRSRPV